MRKLLPLLAFLLCLVSPRTNAQVYDLSNDWSDVNNPNGVWSIYKNPTDLFTTNVADWWSDGQGQKAWADDASPQTSHVPVWMKLTSPSSHDMGQLADIGTILVHGAESERTGTEYTSVVWKSRINKTIHIVGGAWVSKAFDRPMVWEIQKNGVALTSGVLTINDSYDQANPFYFVNGSGGAGATEVTVVKGDTIRLLVYRQSASTYSTFVAVKFAIVAGNLPKLTNMSVEPREVTGGNSALGKAYIAKAIGADMILQLTSSDPIASVPSWVALPAGATSVSFPITTQTADKRHKAIISATLGASTRHTTLVVTSRRLVSLSLSKASVRGGGIVIGKVTLSGSAPFGGTTIMLQSDSASASLPASVVIPAGTKSAKFTIQTYKVESETTVNLSASYGGTTLDAPLTIKK